MVRTAWCICGTSTATAATLKRCGDREPTDNWIHCSPLTRLQVTFASEDQDNISAVKIIDLGETRGRWAARAGAPRGVFRATGAGHSLSGMLRVATGLPINRLDYDPVSHYIACATDRLSVALFRHVF